MSNLINTTNVTDNNVIGAKKLKSGKSPYGVIEAPQSLYKYSLTEQLHKYDSFQKEMTQKAEVNIEKKEKKSGRKGLFMGLAAVAAIFIASLKLTK